MTDIGTYGGVTSINGGLVQLTTGVASAGSTTNTAVTINGGTLDVNNNNFGIGALIGGAAAVITNSSGAGVTLTVGNNNSNGTYNGTITNAAGSPLTISKVGTGIVFLGDAVTGGSNAFTGNLLVAGGGSVTLNGIADTPSTYIKLGSAALTGVLTFAGNNNMVLNNRAIDILGSGGGGASITSSSIAGANNNGVPAVIVINTPLGTSGVASGAGSLTLTLGAPPATSPTATASAASAAPAGTTSSTPSTARWPTPPAPPATPSASSSTTPAAGPSAAITPI